jgi:nicotinamide mononucleotide transporter
VSLSEWIVWLNTPALSLWGVPVSWAEVLGDISGAACVWLLARQHVLNWPLGLANNLFWCVLFSAAKLYADATLQVLFFGFGIYGWWQWTRPNARTARGAPLPVRRTSRREWAWLSTLSALGTAALAFTLAQHTDSPAPLWDASVLALSLAATYGQAQKLLESWYVWILVDVISVPLCLSRRLYPTAALYVVFGLICVKGLAAWRRSSPTSQSG